MVSFCTEMPTLAVECDQLVEVFIEQPGNLNQVSGNLNEQKGLESGYNTPAP